MTQHRHGLVTPAELLAACLKREPCVAELARRAGVSRHALNQLRRNREHRVTFAVYGRLARFMLGEGEGG